MKDKTGYHLFIPDDVYLAARAKSDETHIPISEVIIEKLIEWINEEKTPKKDE